MRMIACLAVGVACLAATAAAADPTGWLDDFDGFGDAYSYGSDVLPAPWEGAVSMAAHSGIGYKDTAGTRRPGGGWSWGHSCRPIAGTPRVGDAVVARIRLPAGLGWRQVRLALTAEKNPNESGGFADGAKADLYITNSTRTDPEGTFSYWSFSVSDSAGKSLGSARNGGPVDVWYDVRFTLAENHRIIAEFKRVEMNYWVPIGVLTAAEDFLPKYVAISSSRGGLLDDVGYVVATEPGEPFAR